MGLAIARRGARAASRRRTAAPPAIPEHPTAGLVAHFDAAQGVTASAGRVSAWTDQSGNGSDAAQATAGSQPFLTLDWAGRPMVQSEGHTLNYVTAAALDRRNMSVFAVLRNNHAASQQVLTAGGVAAIHAPGAGQDGVYFAGQQSAIRWATTPTAIGMSSTTTANGGVRAFSNYRPTQTLPQAGTTGSATGGIIGGRSAVYEVLVYNRALSATEGEQVTAFLAAKYGLPSSYSQQVVFEGDSITQGSGLADGHGFPMRVPRDGVLDWRMTNLAVSGSTVATATSRAAAADGHFNPAFTRNVLTVMLGRNDMGSGGSLTPTQTYDALKTYLATRVAAGWEVWAGQLISSSNNVNDLEYNNLLRGSSNGGSGPGIMADVPGVTKLIPYSLVGAEYYQGDGVHPSAAGAAVLADQFVAALAGT